MERQLMRTLLSKATVGIAGLGGLGSTCAISLARVGVGKLILADFDRVEEGNLDRQYYFRRQLGMFKTEALAETIRSIDPFVTLDLHTLRLNKNNIADTFSSARVIVEALDHASAKSMLIETCLESMPDIPIVAVSGLAGTGDFESIRLLHRGRLHICGDFSAEVSPELPAVAPRVGLLANLQADTVLELLLASKR